MATGWRTWTRPRRAVRPVGNENRNISGKGLLGFIDEVRITVGALFSELFRPGV